MNQRPCAICGKLFQPIREAHKYCSDECRKIAAHFRNVETQRQHKYDTEWHERRNEQHRIRYHQKKERKDNARSINC